MTAGAGTFGKFSFNDTHGKLNLIKAKFTEAEVQSMQESLRLVYSQLY